MKNEVFSPAPGIEPGALQRFTSNPPPLIFSTGRFLCAFWAAYEFNRLCLSHQTAVFYRGVDVPTPRLLEKSAEAPPGTWAPSPSRTPPAPAIYFGHMSRTVAAAFLVGLALGALLLAVFQDRITEPQLNRQHEGDPWTGTKEHVEAEKRTNEVIILDCPSVRYWQSHCFQPDGLNVEVVVRWFEE